MLGLVTLLDGVGCQAGQDSGAYSKWIISSKDLSSGLLIDNVDSLHANTAAKSTTEQAVQQQGKPVELFTATLKSTRTV